MRYIEEKITNWLKDYLLASNKDGFIIGISGGVDSFVLTTLLARNNINYKAIHYQFDVNENIDNEIIKFIRGDLSYNSSFKNISKIFNLLYNDLFSGVKDSFEDYLTKTILKAKLSNIYLQNEAKKNNYLVSGTINKDEFSLGYFVKNTCIEDILPFADVPKAKVRELGLYFNLPSTLMTIKASGCVYGTNAEDEWGFSENDLNKIINLNFNEIDNDKLEKYFEINRNSVHKRNYPPIFKI